MIGIPHHGRQIVAASLREDSMVLRRFASLPPVGRDIRGVVEITERMLTGRLPELLPGV